MLEVGQERDMDEHTDQMEGPGVAATVVRFGKGRVIQMQQYRSRQDALADTR